MNEVTGSIRRRLGSSGTGCARGETFDGPTPPAIGGIGFVYTYVLHRNAAFAAVIGLAILFICMWANSVGALVPLLARRFGIDPAVISAPLISTLVDATGLVIFYTVAIVLLIKLAGTGAVGH